MFRLIIDIGNTACKIAVFKEKMQAPLRLEILNYPLEKNTLETILQTIFSQFLIEKGILSSVADPKYKNAILELCPVEMLTFSQADLERFSLPIGVRYEANYLVGGDRLANAAALAFLFPDQPSFVIDLGTCLKVDAVENNCFIGGFISPGYRIRLKSVHLFTQFLPLLEPQLISEDFSVLGNNTKNCLQHGISEGIWGEILHHIAEIKIKKHQFHLVFTGGDAKYFENRIKNQIFADYYPFLTLWGLDLILQHNLKQDV